MTLDSSAHSSPLSLSICIPTLGLRTAEIRLQVSEFLAARRVAGHRLELCLSVNGEMEEGELQDLVAKGVRAFRSENSKEASLNIVSALSSASGDLALLLGDDDCIREDAILSLLEWLDNTELAFQVAVIPLVSDSRAGSVSPQIRERYLTPSQSLMRFGSLPGVLLAPQAAESSHFLEWLAEHIDDIYPQVVLCALHSRGGEVLQISSEVASIEVGTGNGLISAYANRFPDYGCLERLTHAKFFLRGTFLKHLEFIRFQANLALWISSSLTAAVGREEEEFAKLISRGISESCNRFGVFATIFYFRTRTLR